MEIKYLRIDNDLEFFFVKSSTNFVDRMTLEDIE